jgi:hypothetical protein
MAQAIATEQPEWVIINGTPVKTATLQYAAGPDSTGKSGATAVVGKLDVKDIKQPVGSVAAISIPRPLMGRPQGGKFQKPIKVKLVARYTLSSNAATPLSQVLALSPIGVTDFSSYAAVYDLVRTIKIRVHFCVLASGAVSGFSQYAVAWDPSNIGSYSSVSDVLTAQVHQGPFLIGGGTATREPSLSMTPSGFRIIEAKLPVNKITNDSTASNIIGGAWMGTSNTTAVVGWIKPYIDSFGAGITSTMDMYVQYYVEFKSRT